MGIIAWGVYLSGALQKPNSVAEFELRINGSTKSTFFGEANYSLALVRNISGWRHRSAS
jgi:hypothetical protein